MVCVQLPKTAVEDVEMLVRKVLAHHVDVVLVAYLLKRVHQIRKLEIAPRYFVVIIRVNYEKNPHHYGICVSVLKLRCRLQELKAGMRL